MSFWKRLFGSKDTPVAPGKPKSGAPRGPEAGETMRPLELVWGTLLETWDQRYNFTLNREKWELTLSVPGFELLVTETRDGRIVLTFEEAGKRHRAECSVEEAPTIIEALLLPAS